MAKSILICDDAAFMRMMIKDILVKNGYNIAGEAENGVKEFTGVLKDQMDITMPEMDGIQALKKIKAIDANASVVMCSAMGQQAMVIESIQSGARDFIVKPFQPDRVIEAVKKAVEQYVFWRNSYEWFFCWLEYCQTDIDHGLSFGFSILFYETDREISEQYMVSEE